MSAVVANHSASDASMPLTDQSVEALVTAVRNGVGYARQPRYGVVEVSGKEAAEFLNNQTTNDILQIQEGQGVAAALLDRKAQVHAYFSCHRLGGSFWLFMEKAQIPTLLERLETYHFSEDVAFRDYSDEKAVFTVQGPLSWKLLRGGLANGPTQKPSEYGILRTDSLFGVPALILRRTLTGEEGCWLMVNPAEADRLMEGLQKAGEPLSLAEITPEAMDVLRVEAGIPLYGVEMDEGTLLPETGLERVAVSYTKGCFPGQEVVAKVKTYGSVPKALVGLVFSPNTQALPPVDSLCMVNNQPVGTLKSGVYSPTLNAHIALAYLNRDYRVPQKHLTFTADEKTYEATVVLLPFYTAPSATQKAKACYEAGLKAFAENREDEAVLLLREAIEQDPLMADAYEALGVVLSRREQYDEAIKLMHRLAEINPDEVMAHTNLSIFYMKKGMKEEAEQEKAIATTLSFQQAMKEKQQQQAEAERQKQQQEALEEKVRMFEQVLQLDSEDALAHYGLGNTYNQLERFHEALGHLEKAVHLDPRYTVAYLALGKAYEALKQYDKARHTYTKGIEVAAQRGDLMPLKEMERHLAILPQ